MTEDEIAKEYTKLAFLCESLIQVIDNLEGTKLYKQAFKNDLNRVRDRAIQINNDYFKLYQSTTDEVTGESNETLYYNISRRYEEAVNFLSSNDATNIILKLEYLQELEEQGFEFGKRKIKIKRLND